MKSNSTLKGPLHLFYKWNSVECWRCHQGCLGNLQMPFEMWAFLRQGVGVNEGHYGIALWEEYHFKKSKVCKQRPINLIYWGVGFFETFRCFLLNYNTHTSPNAWLYTSSRRSLYCILTFLWQGLTFVFSANHTFSSQSVHSSMSRWGKRSTCKGFIPMITIILLITVSVYSTYTITAMHFF